MLKMSQLTIADVKALGGRIEKIRGYKRDFYYFDITVTADNFEEFSDTDYKCRVINGLLQDKPNFVANLYYGAFCSKPEQLLDAVALAEIRVRVFGRFSSLEDFTTVESYKWQINDIETPMFSAMRRIMSGFKIRAWESDICYLKEVETIIRPLDYMSCLGMPCVIFSSAILKLLDRAIGYYNIQTVSSNPSFYFDKYGDCVVIRFIGNSFYLETDKLKYGFYIMNTTGIRTAAFQVYVAVYNKETEEYFGMQPLEYYKE